MKILSFIRWKFVVPVGVLLAAVAVFFVFFFDPLLARALEKIGMRLNGAEVNVDGLKTKIFAGRLEIARVQVTDRDAPRQNAVEMGPMAFQLELGHLATKRFVIPEATVSGIQFQTERRRPGKLYVKKKKEPKPDEKPSAAAVFAEKYKNKFALTLGEMKADAKAKIDIDPKQLTVVRRADELKEKAESLPEVFEERVEALNVDGRLKDIQRDIDDVKNTPTSGPEALTAVPASLKKLSKIKSDLDALKSDVKKAKEASAADIAAVKAGIKELNDAKRQDVDDLLSRFNLDFADPARLVDGLLGATFRDRVRSALHYIEVARKYMPAKKEQEAPPPPRAEGLDIKFPTPAAPPRFWLKHAGLAGSFEGFSIDGAVRQVTTDPPRIGKPTTLSLKGSKGSQKLLAEATLDHTGDIYKDGFVVEVSGVDARELLSGGKEKSLVAGGAGRSEFAFNAQGDAKIGGHLRLELSKLRFDDAALFEKVGLDAAGGRSSEEKLKAQFITNVARAIEKMPTVSVEGKIFGTWSDPGLSLSSNLTGVLSDVIKDTVGSVVAAQKKEVEERVNRILQEKKAELESKLTGLQSSAADKLGGLDKSVQEKIEAASGIRLGGGEGSGPLPGIKVPSLEKLFK